MRNLRISAVPLTTLLMALSSGFVVAEEQATPPFAPLSDYKQETIHEFTVLVHRSVDEHAETAKQVRDEMGRQLAAAARALPAEPLAAVRKVRIWVEWNAKPRGGAEFHPSRQWLAEHGYNPEKAGNVEICNARNFVAWSEAAQPCMVLHELAHAYHFRVLGADDASIQAAYQHALDAGLYDKVAHVDGSTQKAYATTDEKEYFAELSEAYFGRNDFFPFTRKELEEHDPVGFAAIRDAWEPPVRDAGE